MNLKKLNLTLDNLDDYNEEARLKIVRAIAAQYGFQERVIAVDSDNLFNVGDTWCFYMSGVDCEHYHWIMRYDIKQTNVEIVSSLKISNNIIFPDKILQLSCFDNIDQTIKNVLKLKRELQEQVAKNKLQEDFK